MHGFPWEGETEENYRTHSGQVRMETRGIGLGREWRRREWEDMTGKGEGHFGHFVSGKNLIEVNSH